MQKTDSCFFTSPVDYVSLKFLRGCVQNLNPDAVKDIASNYLRWVRTPTHLPFVVGFDKTHVHIESHIASKRGNNVYNYRMKKRIDSATRSFYSPEFKNVLNRRDVVYGAFGHFSNTFQITLTFSTALTDRYSAWSSISKTTHVFRKKLREQFGDFFCFQTFESFENGYPHVNLLVVFENPIATWLETTTKKGKEIKIWRMRNKERVRIGKLWHSFIDVKSLTSPDVVKSYIMKDIVKNITNVKFLENNQIDPDLLKNLSLDLPLTYVGDKDSWRRKCLLTLSLCWFFKKRSFLTTSPCYKCRPDLFDLHRVLCRGVLCKNRIHSVCTLCRLDIRFSISDSSILDQIRENEGNPLKKMVFVGVGHPNPLKDPKIYEKVIRFAVPKDEFIGFVKSVQCGRNADPDTVVSRIEKTFKTTFWGCDIARWFV